MEIRKTHEYQAWEENLRDGRAHSRINARIRRLGLGNAGDSKSVGDGVREMRIDYGPGYRVYYTQRGSEIIILLIGGDKSSQRRDIAKAKEIASNL